MRSITYILFLLISQVSFADMSCNDFLNPSPSSWFYSQLFQDTGYSEKKFKEALKRSVRDVLELEFNDAHSIRYLIDELQKEIERNQNIFGNKKLAIDHVFDQFELNLEDLSPRLQLAIIHDIGVPTFLHERLAFHLFGTSTTGTSNQRLKDLVQKFQSRREHYLKKIYSNYVSEQKIYETDLLLNDSNAFAASDIENTRWRPTHIMPSVDGLFGQKILIDEIHGIQNAGLFDQRIDFFRPDQSVPVLHIGSIQISFGSGATGIHTELSANLSNWGSKGTEKLIFGFTHTQLPNQKTELSFRSIPFRNGSFFPSKVVHDALEIQRLAEALGKPEDVVRREHTPVLWHSLNDSRYHFNCVMKEPGKLLCLAKLDGELARFSGQDSEAAFLGHHSLLVIFEQIPE